MRSRQRQRSWQTAALVLAGLIAFAVPVAAKPGPVSKLLSSKSNPTKQRSGRQQRFDKLDKLDMEMKSRSGRLLGTSKVIVTVKPGQEANAEKEIKKLGGRLGRRLKLVDGMAVELPNRVIRAISDRSEVLAVHHDRPIAGHNNRTAVSVGARAAQQQWGYDGAGVGVAVIDSGITGWHDDLSYTGNSNKVKVVNGQRVTGFVDFVNNRTERYDDNGHGTHVAGIIAGNGYDSYGAHAGIAPAAHLVSLKVLDQQSGGVISDVIAAFEWVVANKVAHNIRVINLSVGARVTESYETDPLTLAAKRAVDSGIVVVTAAGNLGQKTVGNRKKTQYGAVTAPGNAPWVLTVGAYSTQGTLTRWDDKVAPYSSRGPTMIDYVAKPDVLAPGTGIVSLSDPASEFYATKSAYLLKGSRSLSARPYLSLSGTSMASPVVAGTVALILQANPTLEPNMVKAILQYTAQTRHYDALTQGAGFLNAQGAVEVARYFKNPQQGQAYPHSWMWSRQILWGNHRVKGGVLKPAANAWASNIVWGTLANDEGENIVWGTLCADDCENIVWGTVAGELENIVWGTLANDDGENIVWGTADDGENIVWGTLDLENIVWGTLCGSGDCENIVWGTAMDLENIVWGTLDDGENIVWGTNFDLENIVWGTAADLENIVWGTSADEDVTWGSNGEDSDLFEDPNGEPVNYDATPLEDLFMPPLPPAKFPAGPPATGNAASSTGGL
jgi:serine protease AprX